MPARCISITVPLLLLPVLYQSHHGGAVIHIICNGTTDVGRRRSHNEDTFLAVPPVGPYLVADGMGGRAAGEVASDLMAQTARDFFTDSRSTEAPALEQHIQACFQRANRAILESAADNPLRRGMGTTAELLAFYDGGYVLGHVGDSRTYLFRQNTLEQLTSDHSLVQEQVRLGLISEQEARNHKMKNIIIRAVGTDTALEADLFSGEIYSKDLFLLCSDGLHTMLEKRHIHEILSREATLAEKTDQLVKAANEAGGTDNITVLLVQVA